MHLPCPGHRGGGCWSHPKRPALAHLLWLLVFVKLLTPPIVTIPVVPIPWQADTTAVAIFDIDEQQDAAAVQVSGSARNAYLSAEPWAVVLDHGKPWLFLTWLLGSVFVFAWSLLRVYRFSRLLGKEAEVAPHELQVAAAKIASGLGLSAIPTIYTTSAHLSPMVWWIGGKVWVVIPAALLNQMDTRQFQWILAHELAHVRRRDYLVRWIEWLACVCFWWNPVVWWARYNLRANEELCCDALVISSLKPKPCTYGDSLLKAVEILAYPAHRPPAMASEINSGGFLERRFKMIVSETRNRKTSRWLQACVLLGALIVLPLGLTHAQDRQDRDAVIARIRAAVAAGEMTGEQGKARLAAYDQRAKIGAVVAEIRAAVASGKITEEQGRARMADIRKSLDQRAVENDRLITYIFEQVDLDKSRSLSLNEVYAALGAGNERLARLLLLTGLPENFVRVDQDGNGELSRRECYEFINRSKK